MLSMEPGIFLRWKRCTFPASVIFDSIEVKYCVFLAWVLQKNIKGK